MSLRIGNLHSTFSIDGACAVMDPSTLWLHASEILRGMALAGHQRQVRAEAVELQDLFLLMCFMDLMGLPNPAALYLIDLHPYLLEEFHLWHRRMGLDRSPLATFSCC
jgi:hypothetical protein